MNKIKRSRKITCSVKEILCDVPNSDMLWNQLINILIQPL
jgi:hypothetical protein